MKFTYKSLLMAAGILVLGSAMTNAKNVDEKFLKAVHMVESSGRTGRIVGDNGRALGGFQCHYEYFKDAAEFDKSLGNDYSKVTDLTFAKRVVTAYLNRYCPKAVEHGDYAVMARTHNGGPNGKNNPNTVKYWKRVQQYLK